MLIAAYKYGDQVSTKSVQEAIMTVRSWDTPNFDPDLFRNIFITPGSKRAFLIKLVFEDGKDRLFVEKHSHLIREKRNGNDLDLWNGLKFVDFIKDKNRQVDILTVDASTPIFTWNVNQTTYLSNSLDLIAITRKNLEINQQYFASKVFVVFQAFTYRSKTLSIFFRTLNTFFIWKIASYSLFARPATQWLK